MAPDQFEKADSPEDSREAFDDSSLRGEDATPIELRPQEIPRSDGKPLPPRPREQALPEKDDDRFFDRWVVDKARILGSRAVRQPALDKLKQTVRGFAEWRSLRHGPAAEQASISDKALVASTPERIKNLEAEAAQLEARAGETEREAAQQEREVEEASEGIADLRPALRGSRYDFRMLLLANLVVFGVDFYIIQVALETIPGTPGDHRGTAIMLGAGAVVIGDALGWLAAAGSFRRDGQMQRPRPVTIAAVAALLILAVLFFHQLGDFREEGLKAAQDDGPNFGTPTFFTTAQILFLIGSAVVSFAFMGRRPGRELSASYEMARSKHESLRGEVKALRLKATEARQSAAEAPSLSLAAEERIRSRERIAEGKAKHDLKQGDYLESLVVPEYMRERAAVESGIYRWLFGEEKDGPVPNLLRPIPAVLATLLSGGLVYWAMEDPLVSIIVAVIVAGAYGLAISWWNSERSERSRSWSYVARLTSRAQKDSERATDIESLLPAEDAEPAHNGTGNGNGNGRGKRMTRNELEDRLQKVKELLENEGR